MSDIIYNPFTGEILVNIKGMGEWRKGMKSAAARGYNYRWRAERLLFLEANPKCVGCQGEANVVDHKVAHKGDQKIFWNKKNWQSMCTSCHNSKSARGE